MATGGSSIIPATSAATEDNKDCYPMNADPRGHCIIINNVHFKSKAPERCTSHLSDRLGSNNDASKLEELFQNFLNFKVTRINDATHQELNELLTKCQQADHSEYDALFIVILSHGDEGDIIYTSDCKSIRLNEIAEYFTASNCPTLICKPKVFIIQACRGPELNKVIDPPFDRQMSYLTRGSTVSYDGNHPPHGSSGIVNKADILYAFATIEDHAALRDSEDGSWFIQELVSVIRDHAHEKHLLDIFTEVNNRVSSRRVNGSEGQVCETRSSLRKSLFLNPQLSTQSAALVYSSSSSYSLSKDVTTCMSVVHHHLEPLSKQSERVATPPSTFSKRFSMIFPKPTTNTLPNQKGRRNTIASLSIVRKPLAVPGQLQQKQIEPQHPLRISRTSASSSIQSIAGYSTCSLCSEDVPDETDQVYSRLLSPLNITPSLSIYVIPATSVTTEPAAVPEFIGLQPGQLLPQPDKVSQVSSDSSRTNCCEEIPDNLDLVAYKMNEDSPSPQGYCIVINNNTSFYGEAQLEDIKKVFGDQLGFHIQIYSSLTRKGIQQLLEAVSKVDHSDLHCLIVAVLSNGEKERAIYGADGKAFQVNEAVTLFSQDFCPSLADKPKLFFIETQLTVTRKIMSGQMEIPDTCIASYFGNQSTGRKFFLEITESLRTELNFHQALDKLFVSDNQHVEYIGIDKLRSLYFIDRRSNKGHEVVHDIKLSLQILSKLRQTVLTELERKREDLFRVCQNAQRSRMVGAITSLAGRGLSTLGFGLIPVTLGGSIALSAVGAGVGIAGGAVSIASTVTDKVISKAKLKGAQAMIEVDIQLTEQVNKLLEKVNWVIESIQRRNPGTSREDAIALLFQGRQAVRLGTVAVKSGTGGAQIACTAIQGTAFAARVAGSAPRGVAIVGGMATPLTLPLDIHELVSNSYKLYKRSETEATKWFNKQLEILRDQWEELKRLEQELCEPKLTANFLSLESGEVDAKHSFIQSTPSAILNINEDQYVQDSLLKATNETDDESTHNLDPGTYFKDEAFHLMDAGASSVQSTPSATLNNEDQYVYVQDPLLQATNETDDENTHDVERIYLKDEVFHLLNGILKPKKLSVDSGGLVHHCSQYGVTLIIPEGAVQQPATVWFGACHLFSDKFKFAAGYIPVSPIVWTFIDCRLNKSAELYIPHHINTTLTDTNQQLFILTADDEPTDGAFMFELNKKFEMTCEETLVRVTGFHFCLNAIATKEVMNSSKKNRFCLLYAEKKDSESNNLLVQICFTYCLKCCREVVLKQFQEEKFIFQNWEAISLQDEVPITLKFDPQITQPYNGLTQPIKADDIDIYKSLAKDTCNFDINDIEYLTDLQESCKYPPRFRIEFSIDDMHRSEHNEVTVRFGGILTEIKLILKFQRFLSTTAPGPLLQLVSSSPPLFDELADGLKKENDPLFVNIVGLFSSKNELKEEDKCFSFGLHLGLTVSQLAVLEEETRNPQRFTQKIIVRWRINNKEALHEPILSALKKIGLGNLAEYIQLSLEIDSQAQAPCTTPSCSEHDNGSHSCWFSAAIANKGMGTFSKAILQRRLNEEPEHVDLVNNLSSIDYQWKELGIALRVEKRDLESLRSIQSNTVKLGDVMDFWRKNLSPPYTWATILDIISGPVINNNALCKQIEQFLGTEKRSCSDSNP